MERVAETYPGRVRLDRRPPKVVPTRHGRWQPLYDLSKTVVGGSRVDYSGQLLGALGYAIKTADGWQDFVSLALETALGTNAVQRGRQYLLGTRSGIDVKTTPDLSVQFAGSTLLVDAKYKGRSPKSMTSVSAADIYEAFAFCRSASIRRIALVYPRSSALPRIAVGSTSIFDEVLIEDTTVIGLNVECRGRGGRGVEGWGGIRGPAAQTAPCPPTNPPGAPLRPPPQKNAKRTGKPLLDDGRSGRQLPHGPALRPTSFARVATA